MVGILQVEVRTCGLPKVSSIVYCCVATLVTGGKVTWIEYIGKDYYSQEEHLRRRPGLPRRIRYLEDILLLALLLVKTKKERKYLKHEREYFKIIHTYNHIHPCTAQSQNP
jgi:hypothetical protein